MSQQITIEDAFPTFQTKVRELFEANLLLTAQVDVLTKENAALRTELDAAQAENEQLMAAATEPTPAGPDLAAVPPFESERR
ncbi:hypothetical protein OHB14_36800 [Streptomyces sp. NBC_01613]|uniref:hypothetical protein n=1 Tax=Streptomyces sp. NBC_01613 TaxID=2975896 RepID=UPI00386597F8